MNIWHLNVRHKHGDDYSIHGCVEDARAEVLAFVDQWWATELRETVPIPEDGAERVAAYFEVVDESYTITEIDLPPGFYGFSDRELATVLAALRYWQRDIASRQFLSVPEDDVASNGGNLQALDVGEIDELCERINA